MNKLSIPCVSILAFGASLCIAYANEDQQSEPIIQKVYICERGARIPITYINTEGGESFAVAEIEGRQIAMRVAPSGSGARYTAINEQESYRWHSKDDEGILSFMEADHEAEEQTVLTECKAEAPNAESQK